MSGTIFLILRILLTISLYAFLVIALVLLRQSMYQQSQLVSFRKVPPISLSLQQLDQPFQTEHFSDPEVIIGRDPACECTVDDETVSARHARLSFHHGQWWLEDLKSKNGTYLNHERLLTSAVIVNGDEIGCGSVSLIVYLSGEQNSALNENRK